MKTKVELMQVKDIETGEKGMVFPAIIQTVDENDETEKTTKGSYVRLSNCYDQFKLLDCNREVNSAQKDKFKKVLENGWRQAQPMIVTKYLEIIDGQHRFMAAKELGIQIPYVIDYDFKKEDLILINNTQKKWTLLHYLHFYCQDGNPNYQRLRALCKDYDLSVDAGIQIALNLSGGAHKGIYDPYRNGTLDFSTIAHNRAMERAAKINEVCRYFKYKNRALVGAMLILMSHQKYEHERLMKKLNDVGGDVKRSDKILVMVEQLSEVYNNHLQVSKCINFIQDYEDKRNLTRSKRIQK